MVKRIELRFLALFLALLGMLFAFELSQWAQINLVDNWTAGLAKFCTWLIVQFDSGAVANENVIQDVRSGFGIAIMPGCNGVEACLVLIAAVIAYPSQWKDKQKGIAIGIVAVQGINVVRIISLFYLGQWNHDVFEWFHRYVWSTLIMLDVAVVWLLWLGNLQPRKYV